MLLAALVALAAACVLFWNRGERYLWQDEAACAELSSRMLRFGKPLGYDGTNLITMDEFQPAEAAGLAARTRTAESALDHYVDKGDFRDDTTWTGQPWGQFVFTGLSFLLFGEGTLQARLPFALAGIAPVLVLFHFARRRFASSSVALLAVAFVLTNTYWVLHARQCRYYAISTLFLVLSVALYFRWRDGRRFGAALFGLAAWCYFQSDFGSFWPVMGVLFADAMLTGAGRRREALVAFAGVGLAVLPFVFYYEMFDRLKEATAPFAARLSVTAAEMNALQLPGIVLVVLAGLLAWPRGRALFAPGERRVLAVVVAIVLGQLFWMAAVSPFPFYRYVVDLTPLSALIAAVVCVRAGRLLSAPALARATAALLAFVLLATPLPARTLAWALPVPRIFEPILPELGRLWRAEHRVLLTDLAARTPDPNRGLVEFLRDRLRPGDEILVNYEDVPLMFYLDQPVRGGIACFRAEASPPPRFLVLRQSVGFTHKEPYLRELKAHGWRELDVDAPDITWGNSPDPWCHYTRQEDKRETWGRLSVWEYEGPRDGPRER